MRCFACGTHAHLPHSSQVYQSCARRRRLCHLIESPLCCCRCSGTPHPALVLLGAVDILPLWPYLVSTVRLQAMRCGEARRSTMCIIYGGCVSLLWFERHCALGVTGGESCGFVVGVPTPRHEAHHLRSPHLQACKYRL